MNHNTYTCTNLPAVGERQSTASAAFVEKLQANLKKQKKPDENLVSHTLPV